MRQIAFGLLLFFAAACAPPPLSPTSTTTPAPTRTATPTAPTSTPLATQTSEATLPSLEWPTYEAPTLAPFPISGSELNTSLPAQSGYPANSSIPLALSPHDHFYFSLPVANIDLGIFTPSQRYGVIQAAGDQEIPDPHLGLDISLDSGTPVRAAASGTIVWAGYGLLYNSLNYLDDPYGISIAIRHDFGYESERLYTVYGHLSKASVEIGERVERGQLIGISGNTGLSTGPHLHFEVRSDISNVYHTRNPELWLVPPEGYGVLVGRVTTSKNVLLLNKTVEVRSLDSEQHWLLTSYSTPYKLIPDGYYRENVVLSNLPAGRYEISIPYVAVWWRTEIDIKPGAVTYFHFEGVNGYKFDLPAEDPLANLPE